MRPDDIIEYAQLAVGFPVKIGDRVIVCDAYHGENYAMQSCSSQERSEGEITAIRMESFPYQLTIEIDVIVDATTDERMPITLDEKDIVFGIEQIKTAEQIAEEEAKSAGKKPETEEARLNREAYEERLRAQQAVWDNLEASEFGLYS